MHAQSPGPAVRAFCERHQLGSVIEAGLRALFEQIDGEVEAHIRTFVEDNHLAPSLLPALIERYEQCTLVAGRYRCDARIGEGSMGEVWRVVDTRLGRHLAMKGLRLELVEHADLVSRFELEMQILAELHHPGIPAILDCGIFDDRRPWFVMPLVEGHDLRDAIALAHLDEQRGAGQWTSGPAGWPAIQRVLRAFLGVCGAVGTAHRRNIVHRDLSSRNVRFGPHGEAWVLDWGSARRIGAPADRPLPMPAPTGGRAHRTHQHIGTPCYMAPELALGRLDEVGATSDVYSLGALLYHILSNRPPYEGSSALVLEQVRAGGPLHPPGPRGPDGTVRSSGSRPEDLRKGAPPPELCAICVRAMSREPSERHESADALGEAIQQWLEGAALRERADVLVQSAQRRKPRASASREIAQELRRQSIAALRASPGWQPEQERWPAWDLDRAAESAERRAVQEDIAAQQELYAALRLDPVHQDAHAALVTLYLERHRLAERQRDSNGALRSRMGAEQHLKELDEAHPRRSSGRAYLRGDGSLTLYTEPAGAYVEVYRYVERRRRLVLEHVRDLGPTPLVSAPLERGSYRLTLRAVGRAVVHYPVEIPRSGRWDPGGRPVWLPPAGCLAEDEVYVPAGPFYCGGDEDQAYNNLPARRAWCDGFVMMRHPVTNAEYFSFLAASPPELVEDLVPRTRAGPDRPSGASQLDKVDGRYVLSRDGAPLDPRLPVTDIDWRCAMAYLEWRSTRDGKPWRLPGDLEWEKAARGVDGRVYPWGHHLDPAWCCMFASHRDRRSAVAVDDPRFVNTDVSPYGIVGLGGNVRDWCLDDGASVDDDDVGRPPVPVAPGGVAIVRGGTWMYGGSNARSTSRPQEAVGERYPFLGFRGVYPVRPS